MTWCLIAEPFTLCSRAKIAILIEHLGRHSDELMSIEEIHISKVQQESYLLNSNSFSILSRFDGELTASF